MIIVICLLTALVIFVLLYVFIITGTAKEQNIKGRLKALGEQGMKPEEMAHYLDAGLDQSLGERVLGPVARRLAARIGQLAPQQMWRTAEEKVKEADGFPYGGTAGFAFFWLGSAFLCPILVGGYLVFGAAPMGILRLLLWVLLAFCAGYFFPLLLINQKIDRRRQEMRRSLPDVLDLLCVSVQAGLAFDSALLKVVEKMKGPLAVECGRTLQAMRMGTPRRQALEQLANRCAVQEISLFAAAIIQADKLGVGIANVLVIQSENMRELRRQTVREKAMKAPVKMTIPLVFCIMPAIFVVILGPAIFKIIKSLPK